MVSFLVCALRRGPVATVASPNGGENLKCLAFCLCRRPWFCHIIVSRLCWVCRRSDPHLDSGVDGVCIHGWVDVR